jgi:hypothetical protein
VLFTDGLIERRGHVIDDGIRLLAATLTELGPPTHRGPEVLRDELLTRLLPPYPEDDVSLLVVHLTTPPALPIDRPFTTAATSG